VSTPAEGNNTPRTVAPRLTPPRDSRTRPSDGMVTVLVPAGQFLMGSSPADIEALLGECPQCESQWFSDESPQHTVHLDAFWIDRTEVTNAQYRLCVEAGACAPPSCWNDADLNGADQPVVCVTWVDAQNYCTWAGARLPTEAEWEKACRGTEGQLYPWGDRFDGSRLNYCDQRCGSSSKDPSYDDGFAYTAPVASYRFGASPSKALDMAGNVVEWVADWYGEEYYAQQISDNPTGPDTGESRVLRGGAWKHERWWVRCAARHWAEPTYQNAAVGFRCASSLP
jgi:formylglycine-generating enzyme required for sulfatase activity